MIHLDPTETRKVAAFAEALAEVEARFGYRLRLPAEGVRVDGPSSADFVVGHAEVKTRSGGTEDGGLVFGLWQPPAVTPTYPPGVRGTTSLAQRDDPTAWPSR